MRKPHCTLKARYSGLDEVLYDYLGDNLNAFLIAKGANYASYSGTT